MNKFVFGMILVFFAILSGGCAAHYSSINPPSLTYAAHDLQDGVKLSYKYDVLRESGNKKYARKEYRRGIKLIAIEITNLTDTTINVERDIRFYSGGEPIIPLRPNMIHRLIGQSVLSYLPYILLTSIKLNVTMDNSSATTDVYPIGYVLGPGVTIGNMVRAAAANRRFRYELNTYDILNTSIPKGETVYGLIGVRGVGYNPISIKMVKKD